MQSQMHVLIAHIARNVLDTRPDSSNPMTRKDLNGPLSFRLPVPHLCVKPLPVAGCVRHFQDAGLKLWDFTGTLEVAEAPKCGIAEKRKQFMCLKDFPDWNISRSFEFPCCCCSCCSSFPPILRCGRVSLFAELAVSGRRILGQHSALT
jgi:hypothetical protein